MVPQNKPYPCETLQEDNEPGLQLANLELGTIVQKSKKLAQVRRMPRVYKLERRPSKHRANPVEVMVRIH
jgi:hypothetical protein